MKKIRNILHTEFFRYCVIGAATTLLDLSVYFILVELLHDDPNISNVLSISISILFAYVANKLFVFRTHCGSFGTLLLEIAKFWSSRIGTMLLEIGGVFVLRHRPIPLRAVGAVLGAFVFRLVYALALRLNMPAYMLKAVSSVIVVLAISGPYLRSRTRLTARRISGARKDGET